MNIRFVSRKIHSLLDYPVAAGLISLPILLNLGRTNPAAFWLSVATGGAALVLTLLTNHETGVWRVLPYRFHLAADFAVGILFLIAPVVLGFSGIDAWYYFANGAAVLTVVSLHQPTSAPMPAVSVT